MTQPLDERRHFWRAAFHVPARVTTHGAHHYAKVLDLSLKGVLLEAGAGLDLKPGEGCQVKIDLGAGAAIAMFATVAHLGDQHVGLHCERIDLDSMVHLRRLVELNAGDPALLERELATLVAEGSA